MAKGQARGNREQKKPKQPKKPVAPALPWGTTPSRSSQTLETRKK